MSRSRLWKLAALVAVVAPGCALCDKCNEPPVPCSGPGCSAAMNIAPAPYVAAPMGTPMVGPFATTTVPAAPAATSSAPARGSAAATPTFTAPPLPEVPADSPPTGPVAPEKP